MASEQVGSLRIRLEASDAQFGRDLARAQGKLRRFQQRARDWRGTGAALGGMAAALGGIASAAVRASTALNKGMANVATLIPQNTTRVQELKKSVRELSIAHGKDSQDLVSGLYQTISAFGDRAGRTMEILRINSEAAAAGVATTSDAIALTSAVTKAYGDTSAAAVRKASDLAFTTVRLGQTSFPELAAAIGRATPIAAALGVRQEELAASFATLTGTIGSTAETSTALAGLLGEILEPKTKAMRKAVLELGVADGKTLVETRGLKGAIDALIGTTDGSEASIARLISSEKAQLAVLPLVSTAAKTYASNLREMESASGATAEAFRVQTGGVNEAGHAWNLLRERLRAGAGELGDVLIPILLRAAEHLQPVMTGLIGIVQALGQLPQPVQNFGIAVAALLPLLALLTVGLSTFLLHTASLTTRLGASTTFVANLGRSFLRMKPAGDAAALTLGKVPPAAGRAGVAMRMLTIGLKGLWRALLGPVGLVLALGAGVTWLWKFWRASQAPGPKLERLETRLREVNERLADLGDGAKGEARALETLKTSLEQQIEATERLKLVKSDLGKTLEALAARDMAAWNQASEEARRRAEALAGDLPETTLQMDALVEAVRTFGRDGKLTPAVMQEIARRARELGVPVSELPPELHVRVVGHPPQLGHAEADAERLWARYVVVTTALQAGVAIPVGMQPIIASLVEQGRLTDANGQKPDVYFESCCAAARSASRSPARMFGIA